MNYYFTGFQGLVVLDFLILFVVVVVVFGVWEWVCLFVLVEFLFGSLVFVYLVWVFFGFCFCFSRLNRTALCHDCVLSLMFYHFSAHMKSKGCTKLSLQYSLCIIYNLGGRSTSA